MRKICLVIGMMLLLTASVSAASYTFSSITGSCDVDSNGTCQITASAVVEFDGTVSDFSIPLGENVSNAQAEIYTTSVTKTNGSSALVFAREAGFSGQMNVTWSYTVRNTVTATTTEQVFSVPLLAPQSGDIAALSYTITMPAAFSASPIFTSGYYADGVDNYMDVSVSEGVITAAVKQRLMAGDSLTLSLKTEPGYFSMHNVAGRTVKADAILVILCWPLALLFWFFKVRYPLPRLDACPHPPTGVNAGVVRSVVAKDAPDLALMCACWASLGYLAVHRETDGTVTLHRRMLMGNERDVYEVKIFNALFAKRLIVAAPGKLYDTARAYAARPVNHFWHQRLFQRRQRKPYVLQGIGIFCGLAAGLCAADTVIPSIQMRLIPVVLLTLLSGALCWLIQRGCIKALRRKSHRAIIPAAASLLVLQIGAGLAGTGSTMLPALLLQLAVGLSLIFGEKRSRNGLTILEQTLSLRRYLRKLTPADAAQLQQETPQYYYQMLVYAESLGLGQKFSGAFAQVSLEPCSWFTEAGNPTFRDSIAFYDAFHRCIKAMYGEDKPNLLQRLALFYFATKKKHRKRRLLAKKKRQKQAQRQTVPAGSRVFSGEYNHEFHRSNDPAKRRMNRTDFESSEDDT